MHGVYFIVIHCLSCLFPECITKGSRFTFWGSAGLTRVRVTCFWCPQPSATVRNRLQPSVWDRRGRKVAVPMGKVAKT